MNEIKICYWHYCSINTDHIFSGPFRPARPQVLLPATNSSSSSNNSRARRRRQSLTAVCRFPARMARRRVRDLPRQLRPGASNRVRRRSVRSNSNHLFVPPRENSFEPILSIFSFLFKNSVPSASLGTPSEEHEGLGYTFLVQAADLDTCPGTCIRPVGLVFTTAGDRMVVTSDSSGELFVLASSPSSSSSGSETPSV
jgi:hypothetical protein